MDRKVSVVEKEAGLKEITVTESVSDREFANRISSLLRIRSDLQRQLEKVSGELGGLIPFCDKADLVKEGSFKLLTADEASSLGGTA